MGYNGPGSVKLNFTANSTYNLASSGSGSSVLGTVIPRQWSFAAAPNATFTISNAVDEVVYQYEANPWSGTASIGAGGAWELGRTFVVADT